ncbi:MAG: hypothetical protein ACD_15C00114G0012 [uncultured bacterium]|nr:MAG: hypothetical protein ACD_15C00114G0012 [uncultured bacterium]
MRTMVLTFFVLILFFSESFAANWFRQGKVTEKEMPETGKIFVFGNLVLPPPNDNNCQANESRSDRALAFKISIIASLVGDSFDVNKLYFDGKSTGEWALNMWQSIWKYKEGSSDIPPLISYNWQGMDYVNFCVGDGARKLATDKSFKNIVLWYDGPVQTTFHPSPISGETDSSKYTGFPVDVSKVDGSLKVSNTGQRLSDVVGFGAGTAPTDSKTPGLPNFIGNKIELSDYNPKKTDSIKVRGQSKNTGTGKIASDKKIESRFYLSKGYKEDAHSEWIRFDREQTKGPNLEPGETHWEEAKLKLWEHGIIQPGETYNIVYCIDRIKDSDNGDGQYPEEHKSDNCTKEAVFTVASAPEPSNQKFAWSSAGPIVGRVCTQISEPADSYSWTDNFFCADSNYGIVWSSNGPIANMRCTQVIESADPHSWNNNYLCVPNTSNIYFSWSSAGPIDNQACTQWFEGADPYTWNDNYLCYQIRETVPPAPPPTYNLSVNNIMLNIINRDKLWEDGFFDLAITAVNLGNNLPSNVSVGYYLDEVLIATHTMNASNLTNNAYRSDALFDIPAPLTSGEHTAKICIDSSNVIPETNESDNCQSIKVEVEKHVNPAVIMQLFN